MLASTDRADSPFIMQTVGQGNEDGVDVRIVEDIYSTCRVSLKWSMPLSKLESHIP